MTTKHEKTIEQQFQVLSEIEHVRLRAGMYVGSTVIEEREEFIFNSDTKKMELQKISFIPALIKIVSEAIDNVVDEHKRNPNKINKLEVTIKNDEIVILDNGGIPVEIHNDFNKYVPELIFGQLRSGSNYSDEDDQALIGTNGLGVKLLNILSEYFIVETADGTNSFKQEFSDGMNKRSEPIVRPSTKNFTRLTCKPDLNFFGLKSFDAFHISKIVRRLVDVAGCNPNLSIIFNNNKIKVKDFEDYVSLYNDTFVFESQENWEIAVAQSSGFTQTSFVNSVETYVGGTHVDYVAEQVISALREYFKKKHKVDVKPNDIKNHLHLFISCNINRPKYSSQTKENMLSAVKDFGTSYQISQKFIKKLLTLDVINSVLDWVKAKEQAQLNAELRKHNKNIDKADPKKVENFHDATSKNRKETMLLICEGLSAMSGILSGRDSKVHGAFPLRGKPINVFDMDIKDVIENREFKNIMTITGLQLGVKVESPEQLYFSKIAITTDADADAQHIKGLLLNMFYKFWPELFSMNIIQIFETPLAKVDYKKDTLYFYSLEEFETWRASHKKEVYKYTYLKGLGSSIRKDWLSYFEPSSLQNCLKQIIMEDKDKEYFSLLFNKKNADQRKVWLDIAEK